MRNVLLQDFFAVVYFYSLFSPRFSIMYHWTNLWHFIASFCNTHSKDYPETIQSTLVFRVKECAARIIKCSTRIRCAYLAGCPIALCRGAGAAVVVHRWWANGPTPRLVFPPSCKIERAERERPPVSIRLPPPPPPPTLPKNNRLLGW